MDDPSMSLAKRTTLPEIGAIVETAHGRHQVMDVLDLPFDGKTVFLRPEHGGLEWTVPAAALARVVQS